MNKTTIGIIIVVLLVFIGGFLFINKDKKQNDIVDRNGEEKSAEDKTYESEDFGFSFKYPRSMDLQEYQPNFISLGKRQGEKFDSSVDVQLVKSEANFSGDFEEFVHQQARLSCAADGVNESIECTDVEQEQPFETTTGLTGKVFYLKEVHKNLESGEEKMGGKGPFFVFNLSANDSESRFTALFVRAPMAQSVSEVNSALIRAVAESVKISKIETR